MSTDSLYGILLRTVNILNGVERDLTRAKDYLEAPNVFQYVNSAYQTMTEEAKGFNRQELLEYRNLTLDPQTNAFDYRWNSRRGTIIGLNTRPGSGTAAETPTQREWRAYFRKPQDGWELDGSAEWNVVRSNIYLMNDSRYRYWRLWWMRQPGTPNQGTVSSATSSTIVLPASPTYGTLDTVDDAYAGDYLRILTGAAANTIVRVTAWDATTRTATCQPLQGDGAAFPTVPTSTATYSFLPWFPVDFNEALCYLAATLMKRIDMADDVRATAERKYNEFKMFITAPDKVSPFRVIDLGNVDPGLMSAGGWAPTYYSNGPDDGG